MIGTEADWYCIRHRVVHTNQIAAENFTVDTVSFEIIFFGSVLFYCNYMPGLSFESFLVDAVLVARQPRRKTYKKNDFKKHFINTEFNQGPVLRMCKQCIPDTKKNKCAMALILVTGDIH